MFNVYIRKLEPVAFFNAEVKQFVVYFYYNILHKIFFSKVAIIF